MSHNIKLENIKLYQFNPDDAFSQLYIPEIIALWEVLRVSSVDAALGTNVFHFQENCIFFAEIHELARVPKIALFSRSAVDEINTDYVNERLQYHAETTTGPNQRGSRIPASCNTSTASTDPSSDRKSLVGIIYLRAAEHTPSEASFGLALFPSSRGQGYERVATLHVLRMAFDMLGFHRVSASLIDGPDTEGTLGMLVGLGFYLEGTRRRAIASPDDHRMWLHTHHAAMLDTDWTANFLAHKQGREIRTRWDEMLDRHEREREKLVFETDPNKTPRMATSTISLHPETEATLAADSAAETDGEDDTGFPVNNEHSTNSLRGDYYQSNWSNAGRFPSVQAPTALQLSMELDDSYVDVKINLEQSSSRVYRDERSKNEDEMECELAESTPAKRSSCSEAIPSQPYPADCHSGSEDADISSDSESDSDTYASAVASDDEDIQTKRPRSTAPLVPQSATILLTHDSRLPADSPQQVAFGGDVHVRPLSFITPRVIDRTNPTSDSEYELIPEVAGSTSPARIIEAGISGVNPDSEGGPLRNIRVQIPEATSAPGFESSESDGAWDVVSNSSIHLNEPPMSGSESPRSLISELDTTDADHE